MQTTNYESFVKMARLDVCEPICLHNCFLLKCNSSNK